MNIDAALRKLGDLERSLAELYLWYSEVFSSDPEAAFAFFKMASEEKGHASLVEYQRRMVQKTSAHSFDLDIDLGSIEAALEKVKVLRASPGIPTVDDALRETLLMERSAAESHYRNALKSANPEIGRLLDALGGEDRLHVTRVSELARRRGITLPEPAAA
ncbi:MAG: hypothetical protein IPF66_18980 [Holophagales bacterium]|nr:hypothetical protein [Holophagales bacterium]